MKKIIFGGIIAIILIGGIWYFSSTKPTNPTTGNNQQKAAQNLATTTTAIKTFTIADVATHNSETSCYTIIRGNVYDVTAFIPKHPGGTQPILTGCGTDSTDRFVAKHGGNPRMETTLETLKIGTLSQ